MTEAYVTLVATDAYASGALVLSHKLRSLGSEKEIVCLVTPNVTDRVKEILSNVCLVIPVDTIRSTDFDNLDLLGRPELDITFTKFHVWRLTQYSKIVYLDADTYPLKNIDELFNWPSFSAAPDAGWPDCFNSGVFVTEPSETVFDDLTALASEKGSFDGGDQGLLNSYFSSWSTTPSQRLPFTFNTTPTAQYGYAPAHNQFGHNISVLHFIGQNKPWKYQRFADGRILPLGGSAWEGLRDMVQEWWNTWDEHYGRTPPYHLLSGEFDHQLGFDSGFQTHPIVPFDEPVRNAWEDQKIDFHDERRHIQPMPPLSNISIKHPEWVKEYDIIQREHEPYYQTQTQSQHVEKHHHDNHHHHNHHHHEEHHHDNHHHHHEEHHQDDHHHHHQEHHHREDHGGQNGDHVHSDDSQNHGEQSHHHHDCHQGHGEQNRHEEHHQNHHSEGSNSGEGHHQDHSHHHEDNRQHQEEPQKKEKTYSMIEWNPAYQDPPKTGSLGADIPDLSSFKNVWDGPLVQQHRRLWVAPAHQPEPGVMKRPEYANYNTEDYDPEILYPCEAQPVHIEEEQQEHHHVEEQHQQQEESHQEEHHHHQEEHHHHEEPIYPPAFPWDNKPDHFPPPTRVWLDEHIHHWPGEEESSDSYQEQHQEQEQEVHHHEHQQEHHHEESQQEQILHVDEQPEVQESHADNFHEEEMSYEDNRDGTNKERSTQHEEQTHVAPEQEEQIEVQAEVFEESATEVEIEQVPESVEPEQNTWEKQNEQGLFAIDQLLTPSAQLKIDEFIATLVADDHDASDYSDRDLIPINFKSSSRLQSGMYTPSPMGSRIVSRSGSRSNSRSNSRRSSIASSRRNSISAIKKITVAVEDFVPVAQDAEQSSKLFAGESSIFSRKTPYTSAAVTPAAIATPEELDRDTYFNDDAVDVDQVTEEEEEKTDFLEPTLYSLSESLELEGEAEVDDWDPMKALNKLREHSESLVLRQSLHEALVRTAKEQERESEYLEFANEPVITQPKRPTAFKSSWDDEEYELPSGIISGQSSPRTPVVKTLSSNLTAEIEMEKERHKQQRASLMLAQPQAAVASMLEAELDLSEGTLFKRRHYESSDTGTEPVSSPPETVATFLDDETTVEDKTAYYDDSVVKAAQRKLMELLSGGSVQSKTESSQIDTVPLLISKEVKQVSSATVQVSHESSKTTETSSFADFMAHRKSHIPNFGFEIAYKSPATKNTVVKNIADNVRSVDTEVSVENIINDSKLNVTEDKESTKTEEDLTEKKAVVAAIALLSGVNEIPSTVNETSALSAVDKDLEQSHTADDIPSNDCVLVAGKPSIDSQPLSVESDSTEQKVSHPAKEVGAVEETTSIPQSISANLDNTMMRADSTESSGSDITPINVEPSTSIPQVAVDNIPSQANDVNATEETSSIPHTVTSDAKGTEDVKHSVEPIKVEEDTLEVESKNDASNVNAAEIKENDVNVSTETSTSTDLTSERSINDVQSSADNVLLVTERFIGEESKASADLTEELNEPINDHTTEVLVNPESSSVVSIEGVAIKESPIVADSDESKTTVKDQEDSKQVVSDDTMKVSSAEKSSDLPSSTPVKPKQSLVDTNGTETKTTAEEKDDSKELVSNVTTKTSCTDAPLDLPSKETDDVKQPVIDLIEENSKDTSDAVEERLAVVGSASLPQAPVKEQVLSMKDENEIVGENSNLEESVVNDEINIKKSDIADTKQATLKTLPAKPTDDVTPVSKGKAPMKNTGPSHDTKHTSKKPLKISTEKPAASVKSAAEEKTARISGEFTRVEKKQGTLKSPGVTTVHDDKKGKDGISKEAKAREVVKGEKSSAVAKASADKETSRHFSNTKTISKRSSEPTLKALPAKPATTSAKNDKSAKAPASTTKVAQDQRSVTSQTSNATTKSTVKTATTKTLRNRTSAPVLKSSQDNLVTPKANTAEGKTAKPPTPTRAAFSTRSPTPPSPPPKATTHSRPASLSRQSSGSKSPAKTPASPVRTTFPSARQPSPVKSTFPTSARQPSPTKATFASKAALAIKSVTGNKPLTPSKKDLPPRASSAASHSRAAQKKTSPVLPVRSNSKSSIATPVTSAVSEEPVLVKSPTDSPSVFSENSIFGKRKTSTKKGKEKVSPTSSVISIAKTPKPKADTVTSPKAQLADHHHAKEDHTIKAISKQLPALTTRKESYASVTKSHAALGEHHHTAATSTDHHHHHHHHEAVEVDKKNTQKTHSSSVVMTESVRSRESSTSSTSFTVTETASIVSVASSSSKSLSFTRRGSSSSSIAATNVTTATATLSPTSSTSSSRKSARERISSFVKGSAFKKNKKIPEEK